MQTEITIWRGVHRCENRTPGAISPMLHRLVWAIPRKRGAGWVRFLVTTLGCMLAAASAWASFTRVSLDVPIQVVDGDTFEADLDGDGRMDFPRERVRLLYVDTPETFESKKRLDLEHGLPAKAFMMAAVLGAAIVLEVPRAKPTGYYGRTLGVLWVDGRNVNLALIRQGHSYFDTRFSFPEEYEAYALAEGLAFGERKGIWREPASMDRYLRRLRKERKTPRSDANPLYGGGIYAVDSFDPQSRMGTYVRVRGQLRTVKYLRKGVRIIELTGKRSLRVFRAVAFPRSAAKIGVERWTPGAQVLIEGFIKSYRDRPEMELHFGIVESPSSE